jgi:inorganic pyrophosphatase
MPEVRVPKSSMTNYLTLPIGDGAPSEINVVIEIPRGQTNKYEYDKQLNVFRLDRNLYSPVHYPGDYGFVKSRITRSSIPTCYWKSSTSSGCTKNSRPKRPGFRVGTTPLRRVKS